MTNFEKFIDLLKSVSEHLDIEESLFMYEEVAGHTIIDEINELKKDNISEGDLQTLEEFSEILSDCKSVEEYGGEGQGDDYYQIYHFPKLNLYIKFQGWYTSHDGAEYQECLEVEPKEVTLIQYFPVQK